MKSALIKVSATFFGIGYLPVCPGTWASLAGFGIYLILGGYRLLYLSITVAITLIGFAVAGKAEKIFDKKDSSCIVIDEIAAVLILCSFIPENLFFLSAAFFVFRAFDILKPFPIRRIESLAGSYGIMIDDLIAAFYSLVCIWLMYGLTGGISG